MIEIRRILCPTDFSAHSRLALDHAVAIARWYGSTVTVLHVFVPTPVAPLGLGPVIADPVPLTTLHRDQLWAQTKAFADAEGGAGVPLEAVVRDGPAQGQILAEAAAMKADLIVLGTHGRSGFDRLVLGSVTEKVLRKASCPVMTVPVHQPDAVPAGPVLYKRILCPVDFSESSWHALTYAISMAQEADAHLTALHVTSPELETLPGTPGSSYNASITVGAILKEQEEALRSRLQEATARASEFCTAEALRTYGKPWREILRVAAERRSDLIVMGVQGRGAADLMLFGSTTQHVVRQASCPVITVRHV